MGDAMTADRAGANIYQALAGAMADVEAVAKDSYNSAQGFKFRGIDAVMNAVHGPLTKHGVIVVPVVLDVANEDRATKAGGVARLVQLTIRYDFYAPDGSTVSAVVVGEAADSGDKAASKALAMAYKYALFQVLCIPTGDDPDGQSHEFKGGATAPEQTTRRPPPQAGAGLISEAQLKLLHVLLSKLGIPDKSRRSYCADLIGLTEEKPSRELTKREASDLITALKKEAGEE